MSTPSLESAKPDSHETGYNPSFPYPLTPSPDDPQDQLLVNWIRNHSSYLTVGHLAAKLGRVAAFVLGTVSNWLLLVPYLLGAALAIGYLHFYFLDHWLRSWAALSIVLWWPVGKVFQSKEQRLGRKQWNPTWKATRRGGALLLGALIAAAIVAVPSLVEVLRDLSRIWNASPVGASSLLAAAMAVLRFAQGMLAKQARWTVLVLQALTALLGITFLFGFFLWLENYVVYGNPFYALKLTSRPWASKFNPSLFNPPFVLVFAIGLLIAVFVVAKLRRYRIFQRSWPWLTWVTRYQVLSLFAVAGLWILCSLYFTQRIPWTHDAAEKELSQARAEIGNLTRPVSRMVASLHHEGGIPDPPGPNEEDPTRRDDYRERFGFSREMLTTLRTLKQRRLEMGNFYNAKPFGYDASNPVEQNRNDWSIRYFGEAQDLVDDAARLAKQSSFDIPHLRSVLSEVHRLELIRDRDEVHEQLVDAAVAEAAYQLARSEIADAFTRDPDATPVSIMKRLVSPSYIKEASVELIRRTINAYHQREYAQLVGRDDLAESLEPRSGKTIANAGAVLLIDPETDQTDLAPVIAREAFRAVLDQTPERLPEESLLQKHAEQEGHSELLARWKSSRGISLDELTKRADGLSQEKFIHDGLSPTDALDRLIRMALNESSESRRFQILEELGKLSKKPVTMENGSSVERYQAKPAKDWPAKSLARVVMARFGHPANRSSEIAAADDLVNAVAQGGRPIRELDSLRGDMMRGVFWPKMHLFFSLALFAILASALFADGNANSMHGYYRDHLVHTFFVSRTPQANRLELVREDIEDEEPDEDSGAGQDNDDRVDVIVRPTLHPKFNLTDLCPLGSSAPYLLVNAALNLQSVEDPGLKDRRSDFFLFSKFFCGSQRVGFVRSEVLQAAHPKLTLGTAMAISGAAVAPNMGRRTMGFLVFLMTLLNVRLGYWIPKPILFRSKNPDGLRSEWTVDNERLIELELKYAIAARRAAAYSADEPVMPGLEVRSPSDASLVGLALSGGGVRSASFSLGVIQQLHDAGVFRHIDYLSTVSGGGYTGCGLSVSLAAEDKSPNPVERKSPGSTKKQTDEGIPAVNVKSVRPRRLSAMYYFRELVSNLSDRKGWINVTDGGHIENLGGFELLRRRCRLIFIVDGEADPNYVFDGLANLIRLAELELGTTIEIDVEDIRPRSKSEKITARDEAPHDQRSKSNFAEGTIHYPDGTTARLIYLKSSLTGDEELPIQEYHDRNPVFPHQTTLDQFFDQNQFDSYRTLGIHVAQDMLSAIAGSTSMPSNRLSSYENFAKKFLSEGTGSK